MNLDHNRKMLLGIKLLFMPKKKKTEFLRNWIFFSTNDCSRTKYLIPKANINHDKFKTPEQIFVSAVQNKPVTILDSYERIAQHANPCLLAHSFLAATSFSSKQMSICCVCNYALLCYFFVLQIRNVSSFTVLRHILH